MKKAASVFLRMEIYRTDVMRMVDWMNNANVTKYLNEAPEVARSLDALLAATPEPMLRFHFNRSGRFYLICHEGCESIGFVKLLPPSGNKGIRNCLCHWGRSALGAWTRRTSRPRRPRTCFWRFAGRAGDC